MKSQLTKGIWLATLCNDEIEKGSPRWSKRGGQSHGWKVLHYIYKRYAIPPDLQFDIGLGYLRAKTWQPF